MKISLMTVSFNAEATIADAMESVWDQRLPEGVFLDYMVIDGASTDGTVARIKAFADRVARAGRTDFSFRWVSERDKGLYDAMNKGIRMAEGEVIGIVNADDMMNAKDVVGKVAAAAADGTEVLYGSVRFVPTATTYANLAKTPCTRYVWPKWWRPWMETWGWTPPHPGLYIRKSAYEKYGSYRADCEISADDEIIMRLVRKCGASTKYLPVCTVAMRLGGKSTQAKNLVLQNRELVAFNRDNGYWCCLPMMFPKLGIKALEILVPRLMHLFGGKI